VADVVCAGDFTGGFAGVAPFKGFSHLVRRELWSSAELHATRLGSLPTFPGASADQLAFELGETAKHREHQPAMRCGGVGPGVMEGAEGGPLAP
jgi:hypothetical protein